MSLPCSARISAPLEGYSRLAGQPKLGESVELFWIRVHNIWGGAEAVPGKLSLLHVRRRILDFVEALHAAGDKVGGQT